VTGPSKDQALQLAVMLEAGMPSTDAMGYFTEVDDPAALRSMHDTWMRSRALKEALASVQSKPWAKMSLDERIKNALDFHYAGLAYFLRSHNYAEVSPTDKGKADTARQALEAKLAGMAGKTDALSRFFDDVSSGKLKLERPVPLAMPVSES
jgi:hypothetical protein